MKSLTLVEAGAGLVSQRRAIPVPGRGQALVRNLATSVNYHDVLNVQGLVPLVWWPRVPFSDVCAEIVELGTDTRGWTPGDRVIANFFPQWIDGPPLERHCGIVYGDQWDGFLQEYTLVDAASLVAAPAHLTAYEAATLPCAALTAWRSVIVEAQIRPGQTVVVQGTGGVSLFALQIAKAAGARVILLSSSSEKLAFGRSLGADEAIDYRVTPAWHEPVLELTKGQGADLVVEIGGAETLERSLQSVRLGGHVSVIGVRSGFGRPAAISVEQLLIRNITLRGITVGSRTDLDAMCRAITLHDIHPVIDSVFALERVGDALAHMDAQAHRGKIVIDIAGDQS